MKVAFLGDSITRGIPKVSYYDLLKTTLNDFELTNLGKGGDTVKSLYRRIKSKNLHKFDEFVLFIGVNDVYSRLNGVHKITKTLRGQLWTKNHSEFRMEYQRLIEHLNKFNKKYTVIAPLLFGEALDNKWNRELNQFEIIIKDIIKEYDNISYLNVRDKFKTALVDKTISNYLPYSLISTSKDVLLDSNDKVDEVSKSRGLYLTLDGCHLNTKGANIVAEVITNYYKK